MATVIIYIWGRAGRRDVCVCARGKVVPHVNTPYSMYRVSFLVRERIKLDPTPEVKK